MLEIQILENKNHIGFMGMIKRRYRFKCPDCQTEHRFLHMAPFKCSKCERMLEDITSLMENDLHKKGWHFGGER